MKGRVAGGVEGVGVTADVQQVGADVRVSVDARVRESCLAQLVCVTKLILES